jgi:hypothetical protein
MVPAVLLTAALASISYFHIRAAALVQTLEQSLERSAIMSVG